MTVTEVKINAAGPCVWNEATGINTVAIHVKVSKDTHEWNNFPGLIVPDYKPCDTIDVNSFRLCGRYKDDKTFTVPIDEGNAVETLPPIEPIPHILFRQTEK